MDDRGLSVEDEEFDEIEAAEEDELTEEAALLDEDDEFDKGEDSLRDLASGFSNARRSEETPESQDTWGDDTVEIDDTPVLVETEIAEDTGDTDEDDIELALDEVLRTGRSFTGDLED